MSYKPQPDFHQSKEGAAEGDLQNKDMILIRVPQKFDINCLNGLEYVPGEIVNVAADDTLVGPMTASYQLGAFSGPGLDGAPLVKQKEQIVVGQPVNSFLCVTKSYSIESKPSIYTLPNYGKLGRTTIPMPEGLRERFTPFGAGLPTRIPCPKQQPKKGKRDREPTSPSEESPRREKKRRKKDSDWETLNSFTPSASVTSSFLSDRLAVPGYQQNGVEDSGDLPSSKKHKKKLTKEKRIKQEVEDNMATPLPNGLAGSNVPLAPEDVQTPVRAANSKKNKKNSSFCQESFSLDGSGDATTFSSRLVAGQTSDNYPRESDYINGSVDGSSTKKKKSKRKISESNSTVDTSMDISFSTPEAGESSKKNKKKKKHKHRSEDSS